jgi:mannose-1-phosphate guanylyltransferase
LRSRAERDTVILMGAKPQGPEPEYGWIEVGEPLQGSRDSFRVRGFHEKPVSVFARLLLEQGALWNTFVMVGNVLAFLEMICSAVPGMLAPFYKFPELRIPNEEFRIPDSIYARVPFVDFSRQVLSMETQRLAVRQLGDVTWSDLGDCDRAVAALSGDGMEPAWATTWRSAKPPASVSGSASLAALV